MKKTKVCSILFVAAMITVLSTIRIYAVNGDDMKALTNTVVDALNEAQSTPKNKEKIVERLKKEFSNAEENLNAMTDEVNRLIPQTVAELNDRFRALEYKNLSAKLAIYQMIIGNCYLVAGRGLSERNFLESARDTFRHIITNYSGRSDLQSIVKKAEFNLEDIRDDMSKLNKGAK
ncbi:MAG: hypothetical protein HY026_05535 [Deltaproteobacteria bacterium]|nr:hypothetical protein [Deltaproteobacteria bacterium]